MTFREITQNHGALVREIGDAHREAAVWLPFGALEIARVLSEDEAREATALIERLREATSDDERVVMLEQSARIALGLLRVARAL